MCSQLNGSYQTEWHKAASDANVDSNPILARRPHFVTPLEPDEASSVFNLRASTKQVNIDRDNNLLYARCSTTPRVPRSA